MRKQKELFGISTEREDFWIGLLLQNGGGFGWADKSPLKFINWAPGKVKMNLALLSLKFIHI